LITIRIRVSILMLIQIRIRIGTYMMPIHIRILTQVIHMLENQILFLFPLKAVTVYTVIIFNILDSILKFSGK